MSRKFRLCEFCGNPGIERANRAVICDACREVIELASPRTSASTVPESVRPGEVLSTCPHCPRLAMQLERNRQGLLNILQVLIAEIDNAR